MNKRLLGALGTVIIGAAVIAGIGTYVASAKNDSRVLVATAAGTMNTPQGNLPHYTYVGLSRQYGRYPWCEWWPSP
jgi:hypothetical protein